jgi:hypothetical protein
MNPRHELEPNDDLASMHVLKNMQGKGIYPSYTQAWFANGYS